MECNANSVKVAKFLENNPGVVGFDDRNLIFMSLKELADNSTDACINTYGAKIHINISSGNGYEITVSDNGCGINPSSIESIGTLFSSVKVNSHSLGKFGLGLKSILQCSKCIKFIIKIAANNGLTFKLALNDIYQPYVYGMQELALVDWSTVISVFINSDMEANVVMNSIFGYVKMLSFLHPTIHYTIHYAAHAHIYYMANISHHERISALISNIISITQISAIVIGNSGEIDISAGLFCEKADSEIGNCIIFTSVNGMPLLSKYVKPCSIYGGCYKFLANKGHEFGISLCGNCPKLPFKLGNGLENVASSSNIKLPVDGKWANLFLIVNVKISDPKYGDLAKTHIKNREIEDKVYKSCFEVMKQLKSQVDIFELESRADYNTRIGLIYSKQLSLNIVSIINYSDNDCRARICAYLKSRGIHGNNTKGLETMIEKKIKCGDIYLVKYLACPNISDYLI